MKQIIYSNIFRALFAQSYHGSTVVMKRLSDSALFSSPDPPVHHISCPSTLLYLLLLTSVVLGSHLPALSYLYTSKSFNSIAVSQTLRSWILCFTGEAAVEQTRCFTGEVAVEQTLCFTGEVQFLLLFMMRITLSAWYSMNSPFIEWLNSKLIWTLEVFWMFLNLCHGIFFWSGFQLKPCCCCVW